MRSWLVVLSVLAGATSMAHASKPIPWTMKGCVLEGVFYSIDADRASAVRLLKPLDVKPFEGKRIEVAGYLHPGDHFTPDAAPVVKGACAAGSRKLVQYAKAFEIRMDAARAASENKLDEAALLITKSIRFVTPADCDAYTDRAHILTRKANVAGAARDVTVLKTRKCRSRGKLNWLLLQELGNDLHATGAKKLAVDVLRLALANCDSDICRPDIEKDLATAQKR